MCHPTDHHTVSSNRAIEAPAAALVRQWIEDLASTDPSRISEALQPLLPLAAHPTLASMITDAIPALVNLIQQRRPAEEDTTIAIDACGVLMSLACPLHRDAFTTRIVEAGAVETVLEAMQETSRTDLVDSSCKFLSDLSRTERALNQERYGNIIRAAISVLNQYSDHASIQEHAMEVLLMTCECHQEQHGEANRITVKNQGGIPAFLAAMRRYPDIASLQHIAVHALLHTCFAAENCVPVQRAGGIEAVTQSLQAHATDKNVQAAGLWFFRAVACVQDNRIESSLLGSGAITRIVQAMTAFSSDTDIQEKGCAALWNISSLQSTQLPMGTELGVLPVVMAALTNHPDHAGVQKHAMGVIWNLAGQHESLRVQLVDAGALDLIAQGLKTHMDDEELVKEGVGALFFMSRTDDARVKRALVDSNAIPAVRSVFRKYYATFARGDWDNFTLEMSRICDHCTDTLTHLGFSEVNMIGDDDYDSDDEEDEGPIESPPFDIGAILDRDLSSGAPGWYKDSPFHVDNQRSFELQEKWSKTFLLPKEGNRPGVGQQVCVRVMLPFGGRGYLYGMVSNVGPEPTDKELRESDSPIYGKGCPCTNPECKIKNGTRQEILAVFGTLHGQEIQATMSLHSGRRIPQKLRDAPLPDFFHGRNAKYNTTLRFNEKQIEWQVVRITPADGN